MSSAVAFYVAHDFPEWQEDALCQGMSQEIFYGSEDRTGKARHHPSLTVDEVRRARGICNICPVQMACLEFAIVNREEFGIWGGSTAGQRKRWIKAFEEQQNIVYLDAELDEDLTEEWDEYPDEVAG